MTNHSAVFLASEVEAIRSSLHAELDKAVRFALQNKRSTNVTINVTLMKEDRRDLVILTVIDVPKVNVKKV